MLEKVYGQTKNQVVANHLIDALNEVDLNGTVYIGYPVLASADEKVEIDALLISEEHGLVVFIFGEEAPSQDDSGAWAQIRDKQDQAYFAIKNNLSRHSDLRKGRELGVVVQTVTIFPADCQPPEEPVNTIYCGINEIAQVIFNFPPIIHPYLKPLSAALQRVTTIKPVKKRTNVKQSNSRGAILKQIEKEIANLDQWQKRAAIESPEGPQRIRGLAGSGKTVVLALKAAYLHAQHPDWIIAITFHTRSLYQQLKDLIRRFSFEHLNDEPNWQNLRIIHAWGGSDRDGVYTEIAKHCDVVPRDFLYGKSSFGMDDAFRGVCAELLSITSKTQVEPIYDAVLIDEAQDLNPPFFQLVYRFTKEPKRIIWAYDELQKLSEAVMPSLDELFGKDVFHLSNIEGQPRQDIILPVCYRNTPWALTLAHALGFGIYRKEGPVQYFDEPEFWTEIGYILRNGELALGQTVTLERNPNSYPEYFTKLLGATDAVISKSFNNELEQAGWVAQSVKRNLDKDELEIDDILIILPDAYRAKQKSAVVIEALARHGIVSHLAGVTSSRDIIFSTRSVAIANIYRSKGNEAPMVYILDSHYCVSGHELIKLRNILFTAITRCRGWVRVCGYGPGMENLEAEINEVFKNDYRLAFKIPTLKELEKLRMIHRDRTIDEKARIRKAEKGLKDFLDAFLRGDLSLENLPLELRTAIAKFSIHKEQEGDDETE